MGTLIEFGTALFALEYKVSVYEPLLVVLAVGYAKVKRHIADTPCSQPVEGLGVEGAILAQLDIDFGLILPIGQREALLAFLAAQQHPLLEAILQSGVLVPERAILHHLLGRVAESFVDIIALNRRVPVLSVEIARNSRGAAGVGDTHRQLVYNRLIRDWNHSGVADIKITLTRALISHYKLMV